MGQQLRQAIDRALAQKPASLEELLRLLEQDGFTVHRRGKTISIGAKGWGNNVRFDRLGDGYTLDDLLAVFSGQKEHTPRKQPAPQAAQPKVNLLVDIQAKLQAGKGAGYARWAKVFNLKQMAQTLNYLSEHGLLDYTDLETKTAEATARYNVLSGKIKAAEKRMAEIAVLRTHIINYAKTRETYVTYRKAGYSRKFYAEHEDEIRLHQAAKEAFNELNVKKLPTIKELQTEYAQLLTDKKTAYAEYRQARTAMRELLTVKNNVELFNIETEIESFSPDQKKKERLIRKKPLLEAFWAWAEKSSIGELPKSKLSTAFHYALNNRQEFFNYLEDGHCCISNSLAENGIRPFVIGRKNWLDHRYARPYRTEVQLYKSLLALKRSIDRDCIVTSQREALQMLRCVISNLEYRFYKAYNMEFEDKRTVYSECAFQLIPREDEPGVRLMYDWIYLPTV